METTESLNEWEMVVDRGNNHAQGEAFSSVFPPGNHEGLQTPPPPPPPEDPDQPLMQPTSAADGETLPSDSRPEEGNEIRRRLRLKLEIIRCGIAWVGSRVRCYFMVFLGGGFWSYASVSLVLAGVFLYSRWRRRQRAWQERENRLALVIKKKEQKINQLLLQIAQMKEMLLAGPRRVQVFRVFELSQIST